MKLRHLLPAALLALPIGMAAVPAYPGLLPATLADGTVVNVRIHGDESFNYITDEAGFLLRYEGKQLTYDLSAEGARLMATPELVQAMRADNATTPRAQRAAASKERMATLTSLGRTTFPTQGDVHFIVLMVQYPDCKFSQPDPKQEMYNRLNAENYSENGSKGSMRDYFMKTSNGKFRPSFDVSDIITLDKPQAYYTGTGKYDNVQELVNEAVTKADPSIDFTKYDYDNDGTVDTVIIFYAGYGQADTHDPDCLWPHQSTLWKVPTKADGLNIGSYCCFNELNGGQHYRDKDMMPDGIGTPVHEFCHVLGLPDLYDTSETGSVKATPGYWSVMDMGPYNGDGHLPPLMSGYERWVMNWLDYEIVQDDTHYDLEALADSDRVLRINVKRQSNGTTVPNEYFLMETRKKESFDAGIPGEGILIWHIDYNSMVWINNEVNNNFYQPRCHIVTADGSANYTLNKNTTSSANAAWPYDVNTFLTPDTEITLNTNNTQAAPTGASFIINMAYDKEKGIGSFDYNTIKATPTDVTVLKTPGRLREANGELGRQIVLEWDPVEGATGYELTVWRVATNGSISYENRLQDKNVGNVTSYTLPTFTAQKMGLEYHAKVRVIKGIPCAETSNQIDFVGNDLGEYTSIGGIVADDFVVKGLNGAIEAPEGAEVYSISGVRCGTTGLSAGLYLVRYQGKTVKVIVK